MQLTVVDMVMAYEDGSLGRDETVALFQKLIDDGSVWSMQGHYGRMAQALIRKGYCTDPYAGETEQ